jgi:hypothetical protein
MRYTILRPSEPTDPRSLTFAHLDELRTMLPSITDCDLEVQAMQEVRKLYPNAVVMPVPLELGSGHVQLLGVLPDVGAPRDPGGKIPFVLFVQAIPQHDGDRRAVKKREQFSRRLWRTPVLEPVHGATNGMLPEIEDLDIELRTSEIDNPLTITAQVFSRPDRQGFGHRVICFQVGDAKVSIEFSDPMVRVGR